MLFGRKIKLSCKKLKVKMGKLLELTGQKFGKLTVLSRASNFTFNRSAWNCICDCGKEKIVSGNSLTQEHTKSCGCLQKSLLTVSELSQRDKEYKRKYRQSPKGKLKTELYRKKFNNSPEGKKYFKEYQIKRYYGLSPEEYNEIVKHQDGKCAICNLTLKLSVDHNHTTGKVRGLLCSSCNTVLGHARDSIVILQRAILYLESLG